MKYKAAVVIQAGRCGRPLDMGKHCVAAFRHGALNFFLSSFVATGIVVWTYHDDARLRS